MPAGILAQTGHGKRSVPPDAAPLLLQCTFVSDLVRLRSDFTQRARKLRAPGADLAISGSHFSKGPACAQGASTFALAG